MSLSIVLYPEPVLRRKAESIDQPGPELAELARDMLDLMYETQGVGLAAPQVGRSIQLLVLNPAGDREETGEELILLNPKIVSKKGKEWGQEGCLSFPGIYAEIRRADRILLQAQDLEGEEIEMAAEGFLSRVIQHELDHLTGTLFIDRMTPAEKIKAKKALVDLEERYRKQNAAS